ncbi:MAG: hypothetical protein IPL60_03705 [Ardenticatenia bacterium]|nr:hypothetical protein [Ardenticatenia bacterium]
MIHISFGLDEHVRSVLAVGGLCLLLLSGCDAATPSGEADRGQAVPGLSAPREADRGLATRSMTAFRSVSAADPELVDEKPDQAARLAEPLWTFGLDLLSRQAAKTRGNIVVSPVSLHAVLSMMLDGAGAGTAAEMRRVLGVETLSAEDRRAAWAGLIRRANHTDRAEVRVALSLWTRSGLAPRPEFATAQASAFAADSYPLAEDPTEAAAAINGWIAERTGDRITDLLSTVSPDTMLLLVNTVYAKVGWWHFRADQTESAPFTLADGSTVEVAMMHGRTWGEVTVTEAYDAMPLDTDGRLTLWLVVPKGDASPESLIPVLAWEGRAALSRDPQSADVEVFLPRFHIEHRADGLMDDLGQMGMPAAFIPGQADFGGVSASEPLFISEVLQKAMIEVNERGIEAAAATSVSAEAGGPPERKLSFRADRPFLAVLSQDNCNAPLFVMLVRDPR